MRKAIVILLLLFLIPTSHAALSEWIVDVTINADRTTDWNVTLIYNESVSKSDYFIFGDITDYTILADGSPVNCRSVKEFGTSIVCDSIYANRIDYAITTGPLTVDILQNFRLFTYKFSVTQITDRYNLTVKLPLGAALAEAGRLSGVGLKPFEPAYGQQGSDGRRILISWALENPKLGETLNVAIVYELVGSVQFGIFAAIIIGLIAVFFVFVFFFFKRQPIRDILPVLTDGERRVMEIVLREKGEVDQRVIVKETDFSKAKVSRIIHELVQRGIIEKISKGRKNLIKLKKRIDARSASSSSIKYEKAAKTESTEKKG